MQRLLGIIFLSDPQINLNRLGCAKKRTEMRSKVWWAIAFWLCICMIISLKPVVTPFGIAAVGSGLVITNKSQTQAQTQDGVLCSISISDSGMVIIKILRLFSYSGLSIKVRNPEIGLYLAQESYSR